MNLSHFFIDRPIFATVLSVFVILIGAAAYFTLPVAQYPEIAPPTIVISASYPGASAEVVSDTVSTPLDGSRSVADSGAATCSRTFGRWSRA